MKILIIKHPNLGENMKLLAVAEAIIDCYGGEIVELDISSFPGKYSRWCIAHLLRFQFMRSFLRTETGMNYVLNTILGVKKRYEKLEADLVISSLGYHIAANALISTMLGAKAIQIGPLAKRWKRYFSMNLVFPTNVKIKHGCTLVLDILPTRVRLNKEQKKDERNITILIGGDTNANNYFYKTSDWDGLGAAIVNIDQSSTITWQITTSPRTGMEIEKKLRPYIQKLHNQGDENKTLYYSEDPKDVVRDYLEKSSIAIVTEDSKSMLCDAIAAGQKVISVRPSSANPKRKHVDHIKYLEKKNYLTRCTIEELNSIKNISDVVSDITPTAQCWSESFLKAFDKFIIRSVR